MAKVHDVARFFVNLAAQQAAAEQNDLMTNLRLQKLLYLAQGHMLARHGTPLFDAPIEAWQYGPVVRDEYLAYKEFGKNGIPEEERLDLEAFTPDELNLLLDVMDRYGGYTAGGLVELTHGQPPWQETYQLGKKQIIPEEKLRDCFRSADGLPSGLDRIRSLQGEEGFRTADGIRVFPNSLAGAWDE